MSRCNRTAINLALRFMKVYNLNNTDAWETMLEIMDKVAEEERLAIAVEDTRNLERFPTLEDDMRARGIGPWRI